MRDLFQERRVDFYVALDIVLIAVSAVVLAAGITLCVMDAWHNAHS